MPVERSAGAVIFRKEGGKIYYLLLHYPTSSRNSKDYWDFPKGHIEKGEDMVKTTKREVAEETGLKEIEFIEGFKETIRYFFKFQGKTVLKFVTFYLVKTKEKNVKISWEHIGFQWLPYRAALKQLAFENSKEILKKANKFLKEHASVS